MASIGYGRALRARWFTIVAVALVVTFLAVLFPPRPRTFGPSTELEAVASANHTRFQTTATLGLAPSSTNPQSQSRSIAFYLQSVEFRDAFTAAIGYTGTDERLPGRIVTSAIVPEAGTLNIVGYGGTKAQAEKFTNDYIVALQTLLSAEQSALTVAAQQDAQRTVDDLKAQMADLTGQISALRAAAIAAAQADPTFDPDAPLPVDPSIRVLENELSALQSSYTSAFQSLTQLNASVSDPAATTTGLTVLQPPSALSAKEVSPSLIYSLPLRVIGGLFLGLLLGAALALILEHLSRKIASRDVAEASFRSRVLAEIPKRRIVGSRKDVVVVSAPSTPAAAAYRMLRAVLLADRPATAEVSGALAITAAGVGGGSRISQPAPAGATPAPPRGLARALPRPVPSSDFGRQTVAVEDRPDRADTQTSIDRSDEPWTAHPESGPVLVLAASADEPVHPVVVANLAASFAEIGRDVIVLRLGVSATGPDSSSEAGSDHDVWARETAVPGVQSVDWRPGHNQPPAQAVLEALRAEGSVILVDAGRVATAEFAEVAPIADGVIAVCQYGRTRVDNADRAADIINWSHGNFLGIVLAQVPSGGRRWFQLGRRSSSPLGTARRESAA